MKYPTLPMIEDNLPIVIFAASAVGILAATVPLLAASKSQPFVGGSKNREYEEPSRMDRGLIRQKFAISKVPNDIDTIIIGSGMGSLSCAAILARLGNKVLVLEQHEDVAGGGTHQFDLQGYRFDSGLHYTVPWSVPIFALTCLKKFPDTCQFPLMGETDGTVDKIYLHPVNVNDPTQNNPAVAAFNMKFTEAHLQQLYAEFPEERKAIDQFMQLSNDAMLYVKLFLFARLLPQWMQRIYWKFVPSHIIYTASKTAEELLPKLTSNTRLISLLSSMWIDTGARPDKASFMMTAAVFRGISMEGGCYPAQGSEIMAIELAKTIVQHGGSIMIRAKVEEIVVENGTASGVLVRDYTKTDVLHHLSCKRVVSGAGYAVTFDRLVNKQVTTELHIPRQLSVKQSAGFVMANIGTAVEQNFFAYADFARTI